MQTNPLALFGDHLAHLRKARGWSQEKLALESGLARSYVSGIERGRRNVALVNICVLADTLGVPTSEMLRFSQAITGTDTAAIGAGRTPLPQISRSLGRLENRDQVWLAEIIRSLSSRLSHANAPAGPSSIDQRVDGHFDGDSNVDADDDGDVDGDIDSECRELNHDTLDTLDTLDKLNTRPSPVIEPHFGHHPPAPHPSTATATAQDFRASGDISPPVREPDADRSLARDAARDIDRDDVQRSPVVDEE